MERVNTNLNRTHQLVCETLLVDQININTDLFEAGIMDSLALVNLIMNLEDHFGIVIPIDELNIDDYRTVEAIAQMIDRLMLIRL